MSSKAGERSKNAAANGKGSSSRNSKENISQNERLLLQLKVSEFLAGSDDEIAINGLSKTLRMYLHEYCRRLGLESKSYGSKNNREIHIRRRKRPTVLSDAKPLDISEDTRKVLLSILPTIQTELKANKSSHNESSHKNKNVHFESITMELGPRMIPPRAQRISNELFKEKQKLPISHYRGELYQMLKNHNVFIINGETGSGKTTQVPQYILYEATRRNRPCRIVVTQPRRIAAVSVAHRVAKERGEALGDTVGYQIRMESRVQKTTNLIYTTSGWFLRSIMVDVHDLFRKVSHIIIDEIHERDKNTDFTLITIKEQLKLNPDFKVILMSATMDIQLLSNYFDNCPILNVPGQGYDVKIYYLEDILFRTGYRTALMDVYLRTMDENIPTPTSMFNDNILDTMSCAAADNSEDDSMQQILGSLIEQCCDHFEMRRTEELNDIFDQIQYYIESEGMSVNLRHFETGLTPLMVACKYNMPELVQFLILRQANVAIRDNNGNGAVDYARLHVDGLCLQILMGSTNCVDRLKLQENFSKEEMEKFRILAAYQQQFNEDNEVDHDLILSLIEGLYRNGNSGAIMVFLPGYNDIVQQRDLIQDTLPAGTYKLYVLHGHMDSKDQFEALQRQAVRKIILSTNIGQTSITVPDLAYVIDSGKVKMNTYDSITESSQLQSIWISQADALQRAGRAGRTQNGVCYRLYSNEKYKFMPQFSTPEFMRIPLTEMCLFAKTLEPKSDVQDYLQKSLNPPSTWSVQNAVRKLKLLGVFRDDQSVTELGKHLVDIPLDVQLGKCLLYGIFFKCYDPILTICAYHSVKDPFILPIDRLAQGQASFQRKSLCGKSFSDQMGILSLYSSYMAVRGNYRKVREFCNKYFLSYSAMEMFCATRRQINDVIKNLFNINDINNKSNFNWDMIQLCLVAGFYPNVALIDRVSEKLVCGAEKKLILQRISCLNPPGKKHLREFIHEIPHDWIVFYEKSRISDTCTINMNTVVPSLMLALLCGLNCNITNSIDNEIGDDDDVNDLDCYDDVGSSSNSQQSLQLNFSFVNLLNESETLSKFLKDLSLSNEKGRAIMSLDNWIKFDMKSSDSKLLLLMRAALQEQFLAFLKTGNKSATSSTANCIKKLLNTLHELKCPV